MRNNNAAIVNHKHNNADRSRRHREVCTTSTGPAADARRAKQREQNRARQARLRERARQTRVHPVASTAEEDWNTTDDDDTFRSHPPDRHLTHHQVQAVDDFFTRVARTHTDLHECSTCLEQYYGMHMSGTECDRCSREVCMLSFVLLSLSRSLHSPPRSMPATATASKTTRTPASSLTNLKAS